MKKRSKFVGFPKEFDIRKYDVCEQFGLKEWYSNIQIRAAQFHMLRDHIDHYGEEMRRVSYRLFVSPIFESGKITENAGYSKDIKKSQVCDMTALDYLTGHTTLDSHNDKHKPYLDAKSVLDADLEAEAFNPDSNDVEAAFNVLAIAARKMEPAWNPGEAHVTVNLYASEENLVNDFRRWIRETRSDMGIPDIKSRFDSTDFTEWNKYRILAYLDLYLWSQIFGHRPTNQQIGIALFPDDYMVNLSDRIRKTVAPMALSLVHEAMVDALLSQALEKVEQKKGKMMPD
jgi:hypothetical protein